MWLGIWSCTLGRGGGRGQVLPFDARALIQRKTPGILKPSPETGMRLRNPYWLNRFTICAAAACSVLASQSNAQECIGRWLPEPSSPVAVRADQVIAWDPDGPGPVQPVVVVGGGFTAASGILHVGLRNSDGQWSAMDAGATGQFEGTGGFGVATDGTLWSVVGYRGVCRWSGTSWTPVGISPNSTRGLAFLANSGVVTAGGNSIATAWNGLNWSPLGSVGGGALAVAVLPDQSVVSAGGFIAPGNLTRIARWNGSAWLPLSSGLNSDVYALAAMPNGDLVAGGAFTQAGGIPIGRGVARWNGTSWSGLAGGIGDPMGDIWALAPLPDGRLVVGGHFTSAGGVAANNIAMWDGQSWTPLGEGVNIGLHAITALPYGEIAVGGYFTTAGGSPSSHFARYAFISGDFNHDGDSGTDADIEAFFACIAGNCCATCGSADFNGDGDSATDADIEAFFRVLAGGPC